MNSRAQLAVDGAGALLVSCALPVGFAQELLHAVVVASLEGPDVALQHPPLFSYLSHPALTQRLPLRK